MVVLKKKSSRGGTLPSGSITIIFSVVLLVTFLVLIFSDIQGSAPKENPMYMTNYIQGTGNINETTNPVGITELSSKFIPLNWLFVALLITAGVIIGAVLIPSWL